MSTPKTISTDQFEQLEPGMPYDDVIAILGREGRLLSENVAQLEPGFIVGSMETEVYEWANPDGSSVRAMFGQGRLREKSQQGLE